MGSQLDLDQGGTFREYVRTFLGPSVGWVMAPARNVLSVTAGGTTTALVGTTLIPVNVASAVTIQLPSAKASVIPAGAMPGPNIGLVITVVDLSGHADSFNITILPFGTEKLMGQTSLVISVPYGGYSLYPDLVHGGWTQVGG